MDIIYVGFGKDNGCLLIVSLQWIWAAPVLLAELLPPLPLTPVVLLSSCGAPMMKFTVPVQKFAAFIRCSLSPALMV